MIDVNALQEHIKQLILGPRIIVGLSGGADSVFLLHQLVLLSKSTPLNIIAAHLQHDWRGQEDVADALFCKELAVKLGVQFVTKDARDIVIKKKWNGSQEELGRHQRRAFLHQVLHEHNADVIALGHQAQDQEETFFMRLLPGASLEGLCGMQPKDGLIIRPLLEVQRTDIEQWLTSIDQPWCQDSDNTNPRFLRNRIRHELLPVLRNIDPRFTSNFARTLQQLQQEQTLIDELVQSTFEQIFDTDGNGNLPHFKKLSPMLQGHVLKKLFITNGVQFNLSAGFIDEALRFLNSPRGGTHMLGNSWALYKKSDTFQLITTTERTL